MRSHPLEVFCCSAHEDQEMLVILTKYLSPLQKLGQIAIWSVIDLNPFVGWDKELHQHLESAGLILLLISPDFLASDYCYDVLMKRAMERHKQGSAVVLPLLLRPTYWKNMPFAQLRMLPNNGLPLSKWPDQDDAFLDILQEIEKVIVALQSR